MKTKIYIFIVLFLGFQISYTQDSNNVVSQEFSVQTETTTNEAPSPSVSLSKPSNNYAKTTLPNKPGKTAGSLSVSLTGGATYNIPVMVPPGIKDVAPSIGISYSSQGSNGLAGWGWNVSGLSTISRIPATKYYDKKHDGVDFTDDRFALDGQRLILKKGTYGAAGSEYQTENYSNVKIIAGGTSPYGKSYGPDYFVVYYPNGTRAWYGMRTWNSKSRLEWAICRWQDPQGNYVDYFYGTDNGLLYIKTIKYGGNIYQGKLPTNQINFTYTTRGMNEDAFIGGRSFKRTKLLQSIQVTANGSQYRKYNLSHNQNTLGYDRLISVTEYNSKSQALNPILFEYSNTGTHIPSRKNTSPKYGYNFDSQTTNFITGDFDGDGTTDVASYYKEVKKRTRVYVHSRLYGTTANVSHVHPGGTFNEVFASTILNGRGKVLDKTAITTVKDMTSSNSSTSKIRFRSIYKNGASGSYSLYYDKVWDAPKHRDDDCDIYSGPIVKYSSIPRRYISGDFNGDGLTDVLAIGKGYTERISQYRYYYCYYDKTRRTDCCQYVDKRMGALKTHFIDLNRNKTSNFTYDSGSLKSSIGSKDRILIGDHNGDGKQDLYHFKKGKVYIYTLNANNKLVLLREDSDSRFDLDFPILLGDYNGDGKTDFVIPKAERSNKWTFFISNGKSFYKYNQTMPFAYYKNEVSRSTVIIGGVDTIINPYYEYSYTAQDINGDGKTDLIVHNVTTPSSSDNKSIDYIRFYRNYSSNTSYFVPRFILETKYSDTSGKTKKYGTPISLEYHKANGILEYGYISKNSISMYELKKDNKEDVLIRSVTNNGVSTRINYFSLGPASIHKRSSTYTTDDSQKYPYVNINRMPSLYLVSRLFETGAGITRYQSFGYHGAVSNVELGFQGFLRTRRSNWHGSGVSGLWTTSKHDITKKGAVTEQWVSASSIESNSYISKTTNTYKTNLAANKVFTNLPTKVVQHNKLTGTTTTKTISYDQYNNPTTVVSNYNGGSSTKTFTYKNNLSSNNREYHVGRVTKKVEKSTIGSNSFSTEEQYSYNINLLKQKKVKGATGSYWIAESFTYDKFGNITKKTLSHIGITARTESFKYDSKGQFLIESTDIEGLKTKFTYDNFGNPTTTTNPYNQKTTFAYDGWNRLISEKNYLNKTTYYSYTVPYGGKGLLKFTNYPKGADEKVYYNDFGWVIMRKVLGINNQWTKQSFEHDISGRVIKESEPYLLGSSPTQWNRTIYDNYGREIIRTSFNGLVANISYNGLTTTVSDGTKTVKTTKDGMGNIIKVEDPGGTVSYTYHGNGAMKTANYGSHIVSTEIDSWGRKTKLTDPSAGVYTYVHNSIGDILVETTPKGTTTYTYDAVGKITKKKIKGDDTDMFLDYTYDTTTKMLKKIWGMDKITKKQFNYTYQYDKHKRLFRTEEFNSHGWFVYVVNRDDYGRIIKESHWARYLNRNAITYTRIRNVYDNSGALIEIKDDQKHTSLWKLKSVTERGQAKEIELGNGIIKKRTYDKYGFLTNILDRKTGSSTITALNLDYSFDAKRGNLKSRKNKNFNWNESFAYDKLDRLTNISGSVSRSQNYDNRGRITNNSELGSYNYSSSTSYKLKDVSLNTRGDLHYQNQPLQKVKYNAYKKPISISVKDKAKVDFEYGILQNRSHAYYGNNENDKSKRKYEKHYSAISPVEIEENSSGDIKFITYVGGNAYTAPVARIKQIKSGVTTDKFYYLHRDYLGSILAITDSNGKVVEQRQFGAWGEIDKYKSGNSEIAFNHDTTLLNRGYTGHEHFMGVGLIHMNGRMYDAKLGRFISPDNYVQEPFNTQSFNRFGYGFNNPLKYVDPSGEFFFIALIGALVGAAAGAIGYVANAIITGNWSWSGFGQAILGGAIAGAIGGLLGPKALFKSLLTSGFWGTAVIGAASSFLPSLDVQIGDWSFSINPAIAFGRATGFGANVSVSYRDGNFNFSAGVGVTFFGSAHGTGKSGWERRISGGIGYSDGKFSASVSTTHFKSGETSQRVGSLSLGHGNVNLRYENDGAPFSGWAGDGGDRRRTAAMSLSYKEYSVGFNLYTGEYINKDDTEPVAGHPDSGERRKYLFGLFGPKNVEGGQYIGGSSNDPTQRMGALYFGYKGYRIGANSEGIRHAIQNIGAHTGLSYQPWFKN